MIKALFQDLSAVIRRHWTSFRGDPADGRRYYCDISTAGYVVATSEADAKRKAAAILQAHLATGFASFTVYLEESVEPDEMLGFDDEPSGVVIDSTSAKV